MSTETADRIILAAVWFAAVGVNFYAFFYSFRPWYRTAQGQALFIKAWGNVIILNVVLAYTLWGDYAGRDAVRVFGFTVFAVGIWYLLVSLLLSPGAEKFPPWSWYCRIRDWVRKRRNRRPPSEPQREGTGQRSPRPSGD